MSWKNFELSHKKVLGCVKSRKFLVKKCFGMSTCALIYDLPSGFNDFLKMAILTDFFRPSYDANVTEMFSKNRSIP